MKRKLSKLRKTSFDELRVRGSQAWQAFAERHSLSRNAKLMTDQQLLGLLGPEPSKGSFKSASEFLDHFRQRKRPQFFASFSNPDATIAELRRRWPNAAAEIIAEADGIINGSFDLLGFTNLRFGDPIDWQLEPIAERRAPFVHWSRLNYLDSETAGDKKIIWEL